MTEATVVAEAYLVENSEVVGGTEERRRESNDEGPLNIVQFLAQLQSLNPTRSALLAQVKQLVFQIENDKILQADDRRMLLNPSIRTVIRKLEEDYNNRGFNRPNCPVKRDLTFHYANLYVQYRETLQEKRESLRRRQQIDPPTPATATATAMGTTIRESLPSFTRLLESRRRNLPSTTNPSPPLSRANVFNARVGSTSSPSKTSRLDTLVLLLIGLYAIYYWFF